MLHGFNEAVANLGFPEPDSVISLRSIAHLFGSTRNRCGIYLLIFPHDRAYIGQAVEVVRRFAQHRCSYKNINAFSFIPVGRRRLDEEERFLIQRAEILGLSLLNTVHASNVVGETDLDFVVSPDEQAAWSEAPALFNQRENVDPLVLPESQVQRFLAKFLEFRERPMSPIVVELMQEYVLNCIPAPARTEYSFWVSSCLPATNRTTWPRLACINAAMMETFVVGNLIRDSREIWGFVNVASDVLLEHFDGERGFAKAFPSIDLVQRGYRDAGQYQISLHARDQPSLRGLIANPAVRRASAALVLRLMRKRATIYGKFHCKQLADCLLPRRNTPPRQVTGSSQG